MTETTTTVDEAIRTALSARRDKALLELREIARVLDGLGDNDARRHAQDALHHKIDLALGNGATLAQVADVLAAASDTERANARALRNLTVEVRGSGVTGFSPAGFDTVDEVLPTLRQAVRDNTRLVDELTAKADELAQLKSDVAAMRRVLGVAAD